MDYKDFVACANGLALLPSHLNFFSAYKQKAKEEATLNLNVSIFKKSMF